MNIPWSKPEIFGIKWENGPNAAPSPLAEIPYDEFTRLFHCGAWGLDGLNYSGYAPLPDAPKGAPMYSWNCYFFHRYALAVAHRYMNTTRSTAIGDFLASDKSGNGYDVKFYRLGCQHPNMKRDSPRMHDQHEHCPDCGFDATYDSSG